MAQKSRKMNLGELETMIMKEVWKRGEATVHAVRDALKKTRKLAYTTVLTTMRNLEKKGFLDHKTEGRTHVYIPRVKKETVARSTVRELMERLFDGSHVQFANTLFRDVQLSKAEFEKLRKAILEFRQKEENNG